MKTIVSILAAFILLGIASAGAVTRGGTFTFSPIADCIFLV